MEQENKVISRLKEMAEEMPASIDNIKSIIKEQQDLINVISSSDKAERFADLITKMTDQVAEYEKQIETLTARQERLKAFLTECEDDKMVVEIINEFAEVIGLA